MELTLFNAALRLRLANSAGAQRIKPGQFNESTISALYPKPLNFKLFIITLSEKLHGQENRGGQMKEKIEYVDGSGQDAVFQHD